MAYREFSYPDVLTRLSLSPADAGLFPGVGPIPLSPDFIAALADGVELSLGIGTEKARSEFVIAPLLMEVRRLTNKSFGLHSGTPFDVDADAGLNGVCDFLLARQPLMTLITAPVMAIVEAKNDDIRSGYGQCIAQMRAAQLFNANAKLAAAPVYGASTTGDHWKFFRLDGGTVTIDTRDYYIVQPGLIAGVLLHILGLKPVVPLEGASS